MNNAFIFGYWMIKDIYILGYENEIKKENSKISYHYQLLRLHYPGIDKNSKFFVPVSFNHPNHPLYLIINQL